MNVKQLGTILGVWAHPDDETYCSAGIMAEAIRNGQRVICVTATGNQLRNQELKRALGVLGVQEMHLLGYEDGKCSEVDTAAAKRIAEIIAEVNPDSILTFDSGGWTGHPDHKAVSKWVNAALERSSGSDLYHCAVTEQWYAHFGPSKHPNIYHSSVASKPVAISELALSYHLTPEIWEQKRRAIEAHASELPGIVEAFGSDFLTPENQTENFVLVKQNTGRHSRAG